MEQRKKFLIVVSGPKHVLAKPIKKRTKGNISFRQFLGHVEPHKLVGLRVTRTCAGNPKEAVRLDMKIKDFIEEKYTKNLLVYRAKLIKPLAKTSKKGSSGDGGNPEPEVITLDDDDEFFGGVDPSVVAEEGDEVDISALKTEEEEEVPVVVVEAMDVHAEDVSEDVSASVPLGDEQRPSSGEQIAQEARTPAPSPSPLPSVTIKQEKIKTEIPEPPESTIAELREMGVQIENLEARTQEKIRIFHNPFLLLLREEVRKLRRDHVVWQKVVGRAPRCAFLIDELFK